MPKLPAMMEYLLVGAVPLARILSGCRSTNSCASARIQLVSSPPTEGPSHVAANGPTQVRRRLSECRDATLRLGIVFVVWHEHGDAPHAVALLRRERPRRYSALSIRCLIELTFQVANCIGDRGNCREFNRIGGASDNYAVFM
jgi:hypothetical protein